MEGNAGRLAELIEALKGEEKSIDSRATSPGLGLRGIDEPDEDLSKVTRSRPRTYPYFRYLPYEVESQAVRQENLNEITKQLYIAVKAEDFSGGASYWTRELRNWLSLKFDPTKAERIRLTKLFYALSLAPGIDLTAAERFSSTFMVLTK